MATFPTLREFVFTEKIGKGSYATVYKAFRKENTREVVAIKCFDRNLTRSAGENLLTEIEILKKVKHEYIVELKDFQWDSKYIYLILEYCQGGDLSRFIRQRRSLPESTVQRFLQQIAKALQVLRAHNISHLDLKPQNILLSSLSNPKVKLADFGFAQYLRPQDKISSLRGSPLYMAPEILLLRRYDARVDLWSLGIILYECLFGQAPFSSGTFAEIEEKIKSSKPITIPHGVDISDECRNLILSLLERDPDKRISFEDFFAHPFVDLEHMPSPENYQKGVSLIQKAVEADMNGDTRAALYQYCQGLQYLVPCFNAEPSHKRKEALRPKIVEYLARAEELKKLLNNDPSKTETTSLNPKLETPSSNPSQETNARFHSQLQNDAEPLPPVILQSKLKVKEARKLSLSGQCNRAMAVYWEALEPAISFVTSLPPGPLKDSLGKEVSSWLTEAEDVKSTLALKKLKKDNDAFTGTFSSCKLQ